MVLHIEGRFFEPGNAASKPASLVTVDNVMKLVISGAERGVGEQRPVALRSVIG